MSYGKEKPFNFSHIDKNDCRVFSDLAAPFIRQPYQIDNLVDFIQMVKDVSTLQDTHQIRS